MTVTTVAPHTHPRLPRAGPALQRLSDCGSAVRGVVLAAVRVVLGPHRASLARLWEMPLTVAGAGFADFAAFHLAHGWGWLATGASLVVIEHLIADAD